jgi:hypothetical protein
MLFLLIQLAGIGFMQILLTEQIFQLESVQSVGNFLNTNGTNHFATDTNLNLLHCKISVK